MLLIVEIVNIFVMNIIAIFITKKITKSQIRLFTVKKFLWLILSILPTIVFYTAGYNFSTFLTFLILILSTKKILDIDILVSAILILYIMILSTIPDLIGSAIIMNFISFKEIHNNCLVLFITNTLVSILTYFIFKISFINKIAIAIVNKLQKQENRRRFCT